MVRERHNTPLFFCIYIQYLSVTRLFLPILPEVKSKYSTKKKRNQTDYNQHESINIQQAHDCGNQTLILLGAEVFCSKLVMVL